MRMCSKCDVGWPFNSEIRVFNNPYEWAKRL
jgi:hypothetical protein